MLRLSVALLAVAGSIDLCMAQELRLRSWLSDHMVLPQATEVPFVGAASPGTAWNAIAEGQAPPWASRTSTGSTGGSSC